MNERLRSLVKAKLWRMGQALSRCNSQQKQRLLNKWKESEWVVSLKPLEVKSSLCKERARLSEEVAHLQMEKKKLEAGVSAVKADAIDMEQKVYVLEAELANEKDKVKGLERQVLAERSVNLTSSTSKRKRKSWDDCSSRQKKRRIEDIKEKIVKMDDDDFEVTEITLRSKANGETKVVKTPAGHLQEKENREDASTVISLVLYAKDRYGISNTAYHELSMLNPSLPRTNQLCKHTKELNQQWKIDAAPGDKKGVQQSLSSRLTERVKILVRTANSDSPFRHTKTVRVKLTGDGTYLGSKIHVVTFGFTVLDEGDIAKSANGYHLLCLLKEDESYDSLAQGLKNIIEEVSTVARHGLKVDECSYSVRFYLGGDWKFLAMVCGLDSANSKYSCIWCTCPKEERYNTAKEWSIQDTEKGARSIASIISASKLPARSPRKFNCSRSPLFKDVPIDRVIIDNLHLFLRVADNLINLLILELRRMDGIVKCTHLDKTKATNVAKYESFVRDTCKIPFKFYVSEESHTLKWRDFSGIEKYKFFKHVDLPSLFPELPQVKTVQEIWMKFLSLNECIKSEDLSSAQISCLAEDAKQWLHLFLQVYQTKHVTPYMHALVSHLPEFLRIHGTVNPFTQQGIEKLNDLYTHYFFNSTNHHDTQALEQLLLKQNRLEYLTDHSFARSKEMQTCSMCKQPGHNKRTCSNATVGPPPTSAAVETDPVWVSDALS